MNEFSGSSRLVKLITARPGLFICTAVGVVTMAFLPPSLAQHGITRAIIGWNIGACLDPALAARMMFWSSPERVRTRALRQDEGRIIILVPAVLAVK